MESHHDPEDIISSPQKSLVISIEAFIRYIVSLSVTVEIFQRSRHIHVKVVPCANAGELPIFKKTLQFLAPLFRGSWKENKSLMQIFHQGFENVLKNTVSGWSCQSKQISNCQERTRMSKLIKAHCQLGDRRCGMGFHFSRLSDDVVFISARTNSNVS